MNDFFAPRLPDIKSLRKRAKTRIPRFAFDYLEGGCHDEIGSHSVTNIAFALVCGADFTLLGRPFVYSVGALGERAGRYTIYCLKIQPEQFMNQLGCARIKDLPQFLVNPS